MSEIHRSGNKWGRFQVLALLCLMASARAFGSVAVLLEEPYGGMSHLNAAGHTALYFDHICAESLTELRACRTGEQGVVISRYDDIADLDWVAMPLIPYLYAVEYSTEIPESMDRITLEKLRDTYRRAHLQSLVPNLADGSAPGGNWYELAGSAYDRTIYGFQVKTTPEQDAGMIARLNDRRNVERYNGAFRNCADFVRVTINRLYPHAIGRNYVADFGLTSPKSVARAMSHYGKKHPEAEFTTFQIPQVPGWLPRSRQPVVLSEGIIKVFGVPLLIFSPVATGFVSLAYLGHGRFAVPKNAPELNLRKTDLALSAALEAVSVTPVPRSEVTLVIEQETHSASTTVANSGGDDSAIKGAEVLAATPLTADGNTAIPTSFQ